MQDNGAFLLRDQIRMFEQYPPILDAGTGTLGATATTAPTSYLASSYATMGTTTRPTGATTGRYNEHTMGRTVGHRPAPPGSSRGGVCATPNVTIRRKPPPPPPTPRVLSMVTQEEHVAALNERTVALTRIFQTKLRDQATSMSRQFQMALASEETVLLHHEAILMRPPEPPSAKGTSRKPWGVTAEGGGNSLPEYLVQAQERNHTILEAYRGKIQARRDMIGKIENDLSKMPTEAYRAALENELMTRRGEEEAIKNESANIGSIVDFLVDKISNLTEEQGVEIPTSLMQMLKKRGSTRSLSSSGKRKSSAFGSTVKSTVSPLQSPLQARVSKSNLKSKSSKAKSQRSKSETSVSDGGSRNGRVSQQSRMSSFEDDEELSGFDGEDVVVSQEDVVVYSQTPSARTSVKPKKTPRDSHATPSKNVSPIPQGIEGVLKASPSTTPKVVVVVVQEKKTLDKSPKDVKVLQQTLQQILTQPKPTDPFTVRSDSFRAGHSPPSSRRQSTRGDNEIPRRVSQAPATNTTRPPTPDEVDNRASRPASSTGTVAAGDLSIAQVQSLQHAERKALEVRKEIAELMAKRTAVDEEIRKRGRAVHEKENEKATSTDPVVVMDAEQALVFGLKEELKLELVEKIMAVDREREKLKTETVKLEEYRAAIQTLKSGTDDEKISLLIKYDISVETLAKRQREKETEREVNLEASMMGASFRDTPETRSGSPGKVAPKAKGKKGVKAEAPDTKVFFSVGVQNTLEEELSELQHCRVSALRQRERLIRKELHNMRVATANVILFNNNVEVDVTCKHCLKVYQHAKILSPCGHSFCQRCLDQMRVDGDNYLCAECGNVSTDGCLSNFVLNQIASRWAFRESGSHSLLESLHAMQLEMATIENDIDEDTEFRAVFDKRRLSEALMLAVTKKAS